MNKAWDPNQPIKVFFDQIEDTVEYTSAVNTAYTTTQIVNTVYILVSETVLFYDECKKWRKNDHAKKSWENFKTHFTESHQELQDPQKTGISTGYQAKSAEMSENYESDALIFIKNIANASIEDRK